MKVIIFTARIDEVSINRLIKEVGSSQSKIWLLISSEGGSSYEALRAFKLIKKYSKRIFTHNIGKLESVGMLIYLSGDNRSSSPYSELILKEVKHNYLKGGEYSGEDINLYHRDLIMINQEVRRIIDSRTKLKAKEILSMQNKEKILSPSMMVDFGIAKSVESLVIPDGSKITLIQ